MSVATDPVDRLAAVMEAIDVTTRDTNGKLRRNERNRIGLLLVHAFASLAIAPVFALNGTAGITSPSYTLLRHIPGSPWTLAALLCAGGAILLPATLLRNPRWEMAGLSLLCAWYALIGLGFAGAVGLWLYLGLPASGRPSLYPALIYAHLAAIMRVHLRTLQRMQQAEAPP